MLFANSSAIITDAFPETQRGLALGINSVAGIAGSFIGLILGGLLAPVQWRLVFLVSVPFGLFGTIWAYLKLHDLSERQPARIDWLGNLTFAVGLIAVMVGITYGIQPYGRHTMSWTSPKVLAELIGGIAVLAVFCVIETRVEQPMFHLQLFRIRAFAAGNLAGLLSSIGRGGLQFLLIIWLQGIWLPQHGYSFSSTPLWAGIYMLPLIAGFLIAGPVSGFLSDRYGARPFATGGMVLAAISFLLLERLPVDFAYLPFALILLLNGIGMGLFASPNRAAIMNSLPPQQRGVGAGMATTFQNSAMVLSIGRPPHRSSRTPRAPSDAIGSDRPNDRAAAPTPTRPHPRDLRPALLRRQHRRSVALPRRGRLDDNRNRHLHRHARDRRALDRGSR